MSIRHKRKPAIYWKEKSGFPTPIEEIRNIGIRLQRNYNISLKDCYTPDAVREKLNATIKYLRKARNITLEPKKKHRFRSRINHIKVLRDSNIPERLINDAFKHPKDILFQSLLFGYKKAKEMRLAKVKPTAYIRGKVRDAKKRFERFHARRG